MHHGLGLDDTDLRKLQLFLCENPDYGDIIQGTGGVRKLRWFLLHKGKRGGIRILYLDIVSAEKLYLLYAYKKSDKADISEQERSEWARLVRTLKQCASKKQEAKNGKHCI
ncbi:MAG: type II toxin-antitoxin system RelE/ParE family toxin [Treponema sp.]|nr:type II toxin-antitoxin system RelE/ParE family toxin [Treponema sp.]